MIITKKESVQSLLIVLATIAVTMFMFFTKAKKSSVLFDIKKSELIKEDINNYELQNWINQFKDNYTDVNLSILDYGALSIYNCSASANSIKNIDVFVVQLIDSLNQLPIIKAKVDEELHRITTKKQSVEQQLDFITKFEANEAQHITQYSNLAIASSIKTKYELIIDIDNLQQESKELYGFKLAGPIKVAVVKTSLVKNILVAVILGALLAALVLFFQKNKR